MKSSLLNTSFIAILLFIFSNSSLLAQKTPKVLAGPMAGHYTDTTALFWVAYPHKAKVSEGQIQALLAEKHSAWVGEIQSVKIDSIAKYSKADFYHISCRRVSKVKESEERDLSFLAGSCAFQYPKFTGKQKERNQIFSTMAKTEAEFMIWMGDNVYYLFGQWNSLRKMVKKNLRVRTRTHLKPFFEYRPNYALWDDHDFGPNNSDSRFKNKHLTTQMFKHTWRNPSYGIDDSNNNGVCTNFCKADAEFFFIDTRSFSVLDSGIMIGEPQMKWLKEKLLASTANFKFIAVGAQVLTDDAMGVHMGKCVSEREELLHFISDNDIKGIVFISGDRHFAEVALWQREGKYTLQEITTSPMTSFIDERGSVNKYRKEGTFVLDTNFARFNLRGRGEERECFVELFDRYGKHWWTHTIKLSELR
jgi:alkaline phosphatase D